MVEIFGLVLLGALLMVIVILDGNLLEFLRMQLLQAILHFHRLGDTAAVPWFCAINIRDIIHNSPRDRRSSNFRGVSVDFAHFYNVAAALSFHFVNWVHWVGYSVAFKFESIRRIDVFDRNFVVGNIRYSVLF